MKRIAAELLEYRADGLHYFNEIPFTGIAFCLAKDGQEKSQLGYKDGLLSGQCTEWYAAKEPMVESNHLKGVLHGTAKEWHRNGQLAEDGEYEYGIVLWEKEWNSDGTLLRDYQISNPGPQYELLLVYRKEFGP